MGYRGDDLDLRTPQPATPDPAGLAQSDPFVTGARMRAHTQSAHRTPIWVDETALECCNHAFDVAQAHRAGEVRIEHLVYALTRLDVAAEVFEARGIRAAPLRREAATVIATEIPATLPNGKATPRRSEGFEEALRLAAAHAYRRQEPVTVADIVYVLLDNGMDSPGLQRLLPAGPRPPDFTAEVGRDRLRGTSAASDAPRGFAADLAGLSTAAQAYGQNSRIDMLEQSIRTLTTELANERKLISGVLQDLQRELMAQREESRLGGITPDKIQAVFGDRLQSLEQAFLTGRGPAGADIGLLQDRLALLERALQGEIATTRSAIDTLAARPAPDLAPIIHRLEVIEEAVLSHDVSDRLKALEDAVTAEKERGAAFAASIQSLTDALERQPTEISALVSAPITEHLNAFAVTRDQHHAAATDGIAEAHRRLGVLENAEGHTAAELEAIRDAISRLGEQITQEMNSGLEVVGDVNDNLTKINSNQITLASTLDSQALDTAKAFAALVTRIESLERAAAKPVEMLTALSATVEKMHKVTVEKYYRRNRFWYWLFGTDDWLAASWPSQSARIAAELRAIKQ